MKKQHIRVHLELPMIDQFNYNSGNQQEFNTPMKERVTTNFKTSNLKNNRKF